MYRTKLQEDDFQFIHALYVIPQPTVRYIAYGFFDLLSRTIQLCKGESWKFNFLSRYFLTYEIFWGWVGGKYSNN